MEGRDAFAALSCDVESSDAFPRFQPAACPCRRTSFGATACTNRMRRVGQDRAFSRGFPQAIFGCAFGDGDCESFWFMSTPEHRAGANTAGIVLDSFHFSDSSRTFELNPDEIDRFRRNLTEVLQGTTSLESPLRTPEAASTPKIPKVNVETAIKFDDTSSEQCTLLEIVTQDKRGLLYLLASTMARLDCNIEVALVD